MIPKSGHRFSEMIMLKESRDSRATRATDSRATGQAGSFSAAFSASSGAAPSQG